MSKSHKIKRIKRKKCKSITLYGPDHFQKLNEDLSNVSKNDNIDINESLQNSMNHLEKTPENYQSNLPLFLFS